MLITALAAQAGSAPVAPRESGGSPRVTSMSAAIVPLTLERELRAWLAGVPRTTPVSGGWPRGWALLVAGLAGAWAIGSRRMSAIGSRSLDVHRWRRR